MHAALDTLCRGGQNPFLLESSGISTFGQRACQYSGRCACLPLVRARWCCV